MMHSIEAMSGLRLGKDIFKGIYDLQVVTGSTFKRNRQCSIT